LTFPLPNFRNNHLRIVYCAIALLTLIFITPIFAAESEGTRASIHNDYLRISLDIESGHLVAWEVKEQVDGQQAFDYRDLAAPAARLIVLGGMLNKIPISDWVRTTGGWRVEKHTENSIELALAPARANFIVRMTWTLSESSPWQVELAIVLDWQDDYAGNGALWLDVGPGIGEIPTKGLGAAQALYSFTEIVFRSAEGLQRVRLDQEAQTIERNEHSDWVGLQSRYFSLIFAPSNGGATGLTWKASTPVTSDRHSTNPGFNTSLRVFLPLPQGGNDTTSVFVYGGGKSFAALRAAQPELSELLFPGLWNWMRALTIGLMHVLIAIYGVIGNWGAAIIALAIFVRLLVHPLAKRALVAQRRFVALQKMIQPELAEIKKNYKGGEQSELILQLYEKHNTSPFASLKPLLIVMLQIPIFVALYHLLGELFELRSEPFLWIKTLAEPDQLFSFGVELPFFGSYFNLLPALMALTTIASIKLSPAPAADSKSSVVQASMMLIVTLLFFLLFYSFPSGMVLYWIVANTLQLAHQRWVKIKN
jgi:YidC/Oxa1 family membrane protein insertase